MAKKRVLVSFDFDNDKVLKECINQQARREDSPFDVVDTLLKEESPQASWESTAETRTKGAARGLVVVGASTHRSPGVLKEVGFARKWNIPIAQVIGYRGTHPTTVPNAGQLYWWDWDNLKKLLN